MRLLSRNAEALFWLARYLARAAALARVIEMQSSFGRSGQDQDTSWAWLVTLHSDEEHFRERYEEPTNANIIRFYIDDRENPGSIRTVIHWARENARTLRPFMPIEMWVQINDFYGQVQSFDDEDFQFAQLPRTCAAIRAGCLAQIGIAESTLYRDEGFNFFTLGLMIERADQTSRLLDVKFAQRQTGGASDDPGDEFVFWSSILRTAAAYQVFRRLEPTGADAERVARFLILDRRHPRSIGFCTEQIGGQLQELRSRFRLVNTNACLERVEVLMEGLQAAGNDPTLISSLHEFNDWVQRTLIKLTSDIGTAFFRPPIVPPQQSQSQSQS